MFRLILNVEPYALCEWELRPEIDRVGGPTHVGFPRVGAGLTVPACLLFAAKGTADLGSRRPNVHVGDAAVRTHCRDKCLRLAHIKRKDRGGEARTDGVVQSHCLIELRITQHVKNRRKGFAQHRT
jgi:hypothetical protein